MRGSYKTRVDYFNKRGFSEDRNLEADYELSNHNPARKDIGIVVFCSWIKLAELEILRNKLEQRA